MSSFFLAHFHESFLNSNTPATNGLSKNLPLCIRIHHKAMLMALQAKAGLMKQLKGWTLRVTEDPAFLYINLSFGNGIQKSSRLYYEIVSALHARIPANLKSYPLQWEIKPSLLAEWLGPMDKYSVVEEIQWTFSTDGKFQISTPQDDPTPLQIAIDMDHEAAYETNQDAMNHARRTLVLPSRPLRLALSLTELKVFSSLASYFNGVTEAFLNDPPAPCVFRLFSSGLKSIITLSENDSTVIYSNKRLEKFGSNKESSSNSLDIIQSNNFSIQLLLMPSISTDHCLDRSSSFGLSQRSYNSSISKPYDVHSKGSDLNVNLHKKSSTTETSQNPSEIVNNGPEKSSTEEHLRFRPPINNQELTISSDSPSISSTICNKRPREDYLSESLNTSEKYMSVTNNPFDDSHANVSSQELFPLTKPSNFLFPFPSSNNHSLQKLPELPQSFSSTSLLEKRTENLLSPRNQAIPTPYLQSNSLSNQIPASVDFPIDSNIDELVVLQHFLNDQQDYNTDDESIPPTP